MNDLIRKNEERVNKLLQEPLRMLIGGEMVEALGGETLETYKPYSEEVLTSAPFAQKADIDRAVEAASKAFATWSKKSVIERINYVHKFIEVLEANAEDLGLLDAANSGNPVTAMIGDVRMACGMLRFQAGVAMEIKGQTIPSTSENWHITRREPYGVVGRIIPYNHPILFAAAKIGAPVLTGNTLILKVPDQAPSAPLYMAKLMKDVFPPGVVNIVSGNGAVTGDAIVRHPKMKRIALIGSVETGRKIQHAAAEVGIKHVSLELGGKNPMIVYPDADLDAAVEASVFGMNFHWCQGQSCGSTSRLFLHRDIHDEFIVKLKDRIRKIKIGHPLDPESEMGCLVSKPQFDKVNHYIHSGKEQGAECVIGGDRPEGYEKGYFINPTVFTNVRYDMRIAQEEIFGPVLSVISWENEEKVIEQANSVAYGLTAAVWTRDINRAFKVIDRLDAGFTWINGSSRHFPGVPFAGQKNSGLDSEEGIEELYSFTQSKTVNVMIR